RRDPTPHRSPRSLRNEDGGTVCHRKWRKSSESGRKARTSSSSAWARSSPPAKSRKKTLSSIWSRASIARKKEKAGIDGHRPPYPLSRDVLRSRDLSNGMILVEYLAGFVEPEGNLGSGGLREAGRTNIPRQIEIYNEASRATLYRAPAIPDPNAYPRGDAGERPEGHPAADLRHAGRLHLGRLPHRLAQRSPRHDRLHPLGRAYVVQGRRQARQGGHRQAHLAPRRQDERLHGHGLHDVLRDDPRERDGHGPHDRIGEDAQRGLRSEGGRGRADGRHQRAGGRG